MFLPHQGRYDCLKSRSYLPLFSHPICSWHTHSYQLCRIFLPVVFLSQHRPSSTNSFLCSLQIFTFLSFLRLKASSRSYHKVPSLVSMRILGQSSSRSTPAQAQLASACQTQMGRIYHSQAYSSSDCPTDPSSFHLSKSLGYSWWAPDGSRLS